MANARALLKGRRATQNTRKITKTMELVSTARLSRAQQAAIAARPYARKLRQVIASVAAASADLRHPLLETHRPARRAVVLVLTSDRGLCGAFNANILRQFQVFHEELKRRGLAVEFLVQGRKGVAVFKYQGLPVAQAFLRVSDKPTYARADEIGSALIERFQRREVDEAYLVYSSFRSMVSQVAKVEQLLPLAGLDAPAGAVAGKAAAYGVEYLFHPGPEPILHELLPQVVKTSIFTALLDNCAGEHAARRVAMKNATDAADDLIKSLTQQYNRARQSKITQEISEIVGGAEAL